MHTYWAWAIGKVEIMSRSRDKDGAEHEEDTVS